MPPTRKLHLPGDLTVVGSADPRQLTTFVLQEQGDWFEEELRFLRRALRAGQSWVDVGANFGVYTLTGAQCVGPDGRVWAFEPAPFPQACLSESLAVNGLSWVTLRSEALSDRTGDGWLAAGPSDELNRLGKANEAGFPVALTTLDAARAMFNRPIDFLKLDAEGEEPRILAGAAAFFAEHDPLVQCELASDPAARRALFDALAAHGLGLHRLLPGLGVLVPHTSDEPLDAFQVNVFACRPSRAAQLAAADLLVSAPAELTAAAPEEDRAFVLRWMADRPWPRALWPAGWPTTPPRLLEALAALLRGEDSTRSAAERWAWLRRAQRILTSPRPPSLAWLLPAARVASAHGARQQACHCLGLAEPFLPAADEAEFRGPLLLPPLPALDALDPAGASPATILRAMLDEAIVDRAAHSVCFALPRLLPTLERLAASPLASPAARRRLAAVRAAQAADSAAQASHP